MYIITRYVVWEVLKYFLATLMALILIITPVMGVSEGLKNGFPASVIVWIMPYMLPLILGIAMPVAMLFSVCSVFGRMTGSNEVVALKSLGISPMAVIWPALVLAAFLSLGTVWMHELAATWSKLNVLRVGTESIEEIAYSKLQKDGYYNDDRLSITVKDVRDKRLIEPTIILKGPGGRPKVTLLVSEAILHTDWKAHTLQIDCYRGTIDIQGQMRVSFDDWQHHTMPIEIPPPPPFHRDWVSLRDVPRLVVALNGEIATIQAELQRLNEYQAASKSLGVPELPDDAAKIAAKTAEIEYRQFLIRRLQTEPYRRWANGFTCLCFALIGAPVAMLWRHADALTNFFVCFLPILAIYYPLLMLSDDLPTSGKLWPISFWLANVVLVIPSVFLLRHIVRH